MTEIWNWYIELFFDTDNKVKIAAWTATITSITFIITFILRPLLKYIRCKLLKIKVKAGISHQIVTSAFGGGVQAPLLTCTITNHDNKVIFIKNPSIKLSQSVNGDNTFVVPIQKGTFPMRFEAGQQITFDYNTVNLYNQLLRHISPEKKVSFIVTTTTGKKYYSNKFSRKLITGHIEVADKMNKSGRFN